MPPIYPPCAETATNIALVVHGGAGNILRANIPPELEAAFAAGLVAALEAGYARLRDGSALDAVEAAVRVLEDDPIFNAGRGAVFTADGRNEMDAAVMDGASGKAGAVTGATRAKHPVTLARAVMEQTPFVLLSGAGADRFAEASGVETADAPYFWTELRWKQLLSAQERERDGTADYTVSLSEDNKFGTVGAIALDTAGNLAAATSTGGMTNKRYGRVGDSPLIGAGTWADNLCAASATGHGEYFIRFAALYDIAARMRYAGASVAGAAHAVIHERLAAVGGSGGLIALDRHGSAALPFNTAGMYRGYVTRGGAIHLSFYGAGG